MEYVLVRSLIEFKKIVEVCRAWEIDAFRYPVEVPSDVVLMLGTKRVSVD